MISVLYAITNMPLPSEWAICSVAFSLQPV